MLLIWNSEILKTHIYIYIYADSLGFYNLPFLANVFMRTKVTCFRNKY